MPRHRRSQTCKPHQHSNFLALCPRWASIHISTGDVTLAGMSDGVMPPEVLKCLGKQKMEDEGLCGNPSCRAVHRRIPVWRPLNRIRIFGTAPGTSGRQKVLPHDEGAAWSYEYVLQLSSKLSISKPSRAKHVGRRACTGTNLPFRSSTSVSRLVSGGDEVSAAPSQKALMPKLQPELHSPIFESQSSSSAGRSRKP